MTPDSRHAAARCRRLMIVAASVLGSFEAIALSADGPILVVPSCDTALHVVTPVPASAALPAGHRYMLSELGAVSEVVPVDLVPATPREGDTDSRARRLVCVVPPRDGATGERRFRLMPADDPKHDARMPHSFRLAELDDKSLGLWEGQRPVLVYNHGAIAGDGVPADRTRSTYVHPLYGLDGEVLTDDFPQDHLHHRGLFWAWPHVRVGDKHYDLWLLRGIRHEFERWLTRHAGPSSAVLTVENGWYVDRRRVMGERVRLTVFPARQGARIIDVELTWTATEAPVTLWGAAGKSYGGLSLRFAPRKETRIITDRGPAERDLNLTRLRWADLSARFRGAAPASGAAIFVDPAHPDYPPMWITRQYGFLGLGWPGPDRFTLRPGEPVRCRYRIWIHRGPAAPATLHEVDEARRLGSQVRWMAPTRSSQIR